MKHKESEKFELTNLDKAIILVRELTDDEIRRLEIFIQSEKLKRRQQQQRLEIPGHDYTDKGIILDKEDQ